MNKIIKVNNLTFSYTQEPLLKDLTFEITQGSFISIAGPNGAGKTTLLNLLCGLLKPQAGYIEIDSAAIQQFSARKLARKIAVVRQEFIPVFDFTAAQIVSMARMPYSHTFGFESKTDKQLIEEALEITDTLQFADRSMGNLSSGERQRVFIARAIAQNTAIMLLDEPTNFLDLKHQVNIFDLLKTAQTEKGRTIIAVTHDINLAAQYADYALLIGPKGRYKFGFSEEIFTKPEIEALFGVKVFSDRVNEANFFLPLGNFAKDSRKIT
jgi:iron complex transport system ATP-binding protein